MKTVPVMLILAVSTFLSGILRNWDAPDRLDSRITWLTIILAFGFAEILRRMDRGQK